uniref:C2H2-type domain-containing protein n=1 Tax=Kalanchoe fedtschenkoi TaxID=63787 RepID=A0A7N0UFE7_KALFE
MDTATRQSSKWDSKNPVHWTEVRRAVVPQELPDWPLLSQDINFLTCKFCGRKYYSTINLRRHEFFHVQRGNYPDCFDDANKNSSLKKFWHEGSRDLIKDVLSLQDVELKGITWHKIVEELASIPDPNIRLPPLYFTVRHWILDTIKSEESEFSRYPDKFLAILFGGSEKTFLHNDTDEPVQSHIFRDADEIALAQENLVATACFLLEQKLRKVWDGHCKDEITSLQNELIKEEEDEKTRQPKTEGNKVEGKKKKNRKNKPKKKIVDYKSEDGNLGQTSDTQQSTATSRPEVPTSIEENSVTPIAQLEHLPDAAHIRDAKQEDGECKLKEEGTKEQKSEKGKKKKNNKKGKKPKKPIARDNSEEGNLGQTSDIQQSTATSIPEVPTSVEEDSQTPLEQLPDASHIHDAKKEDGECKLEEEGSKEQKSEDKICQDMTEPSDSLPDGGGPSSEHPIRTQVEEDKETSELLSTKEICSSSAPSQVAFEGQLQLEEPVYSDHEDHQLIRDRFQGQLVLDRCRRHESSKAVQTSSHMRRKSAPPRMQRVPKVVIPKNVERGKCGKKDATVEGMQPSGQHETGAAASVGAHHTTRKIIDSDVGGCSISVRTQHTDGTNHASRGSEEDAPIAPLSVDDLNKFQANLASARALMLSWRHNQDQNQS